MSTRALSTETNAATTEELTDIPSDTLRLGTDEERAYHYYSRIARTVLTVETDGSTHRETLGDRPLEAWIAYVEEKRGWETLKYVESFVDIFDRVRVV